MFTGIIESVGKLTALRSTGDSARVTVLASWADGEVPGVSLGDSVAVNGVCLTVVEHTATPDGVSLAFDVSHETLARTSLGDLGVGGVVNLERALRVGDRLGGHWVTGHVDATGTRSKVVDRGEAWDLIYRVPKALEPELVAKGSVCIDGVSLTVNRVWEGHFSVTIIPHTAANTQLLEGQAAKTVNLETDIVGKYLRRFIDLGLGKTGEEGITLEKLAGYGFMGDD